MARRAIDGAELRAMLAHLFASGYSLGATDSRIDEQLERVGESVALVDWPRRDAS